MLNVGTLTQLCNVNFEEIRVPSWIENTKQMEELMEDAVAQEERRVISARSTRSNASLSPSSLSGSTWAFSTDSCLSDTALNQDYTQDNVLTPLDVEALIQTERLTKILDECIYKSKLAICVPELVTEFHTLNSILSSDDMEDLLMIFDQYDHAQSCTSLLNVAAMDEIKSGEITLKNRLNPELAHILFILNSRAELKPKVEEMITQMIQSCLVEGEKMPPPLEYLWHLHTFRNMMAKQLATPAAEELRVKLSTKKLEVGNAKLVKQIKVMSERIVQGKEDFEKSTAEKRNLIKNLEEEVETLRAESSAALAKQILDSDRQMVLLSREHEANYELLQQEQDDAQRSFEKLLGDHVLQEKKLRGRKFKVETQLSSWLNKYDVEMAEKQLELDDFLQKYDDELKQCQELEEKIEIQNKEYIPLMEERDQEYHRELTEKMERFRAQHAARVIQVAWRNTLANRAEKKKLNKLLKKMLAKAKAETMPEKDQKKKGKEVKKKKK